MLFKKVFCSFGILIWSSMSFAQNSESINGKVVDNCQKSIPYVNVVLLSSKDSSLVNGSVTKEDGCFQIAAVPASYILKISCMGYKEIFKSVRSIHGQNDLGKFQMEEDSHLLKEVAITASRSVFQTKNGILTTDVANSSLSKEHSVNDILLKIPSVVNNKGSLEVFGFGEPSIYINGRKMADASELKQLTVDEIKKIELITVPDASYDADGKPVLKIITYHKQDGFFGQIDVSTIKNQYFSTENDIKIGYILRSLNLSANYGYSYKKSKITQPFQEWLYSDTTWFIQGSRPRVDTYKIPTYRLSADFAINKHNSIGIQYDGSFLDRHNKANEMDDVFTNENLYRQLKTMNIEDQTTNKQHLNFFYISQWDNNWNAEVYADYFNNNSTKLQNTQEVADETVTRDIDVNSGSETNLYIGKAMIRYSFQNNWVSMGASADKVLGKGWVASNTTFVNNASYQNEGKKMAFFAQSSFRYRNINLMAGLRYEHAVESYTDQYNSINNIQKTYSDFFPSLSLSYNKNSFTQTLSLTTSTTRPAFSLLNSNIYYMNQFMYQRGNPALQPQLTYIISESMGYKFINISVRYKYINNYITQIFSSTNNNHQIINTWENIDHAQTLQGGITLQHSFQWWKPTLSIGVIQPFISFFYRNNKIDNNKMNFYFRANNYIDLPHQYLISVNYYYNNGGSQNMSRFKPFQSFDLSIQKSLLNGLLNLSVQGNDLFHTLTYKTETYVNNVQQIQSENYSQWNFTFNVVYKFNGKSSKYRGKSADQDEINRL